MIYHIYIIYCAQSKLESECPYYQPTQCDFTKYFYFQCYLFIIETLYITKSVIYGIVLVKNVKSVFTLKQIYFSIPAQTAVEVISDQFHHITLDSKSGKFWKKSAKTRSFGNFFHCEGGGHLFPKVYVRIVTKKWTFLWRPKMLQMT